MNSTCGRCARFARLPVTRLSTTRTVSPRRTSSVHRCEPMKPAPPVTRYALMNDRLLLGESRARQAGHELQGVLVIELSQHLIGECQPVQLPERVVIAVVVEVLVAGLKRAPEV